MPFYVMKSQWYWLSIWLLALGLTVAPLGSTQAQTTEICSNGIDDDGDRLIDCQDPDCPECVRFESCVQANTCYMPPVWGIPNATGSAVYGAQDLVLSTNAPFTTVTIRTADGSYTRTVGVTSGGPTIVSLPLSVVFSDQPNTKQTSKGLIITSSEPVQATYRQTPTLNQDIVPLKCRAALGYAFYAGSQTRLGGNNIASERHFVSIMATLDGTTVSVRSPIDFEGYPANTPFTVSLNAGETFMLTSRLLNSGANSENRSVAGTLITSDPDHPIVVNSGSQHTVQPYSGNRDAGIDQLVPARTTGTDYVAVKSLNTTANSDYVFLVAIENNTTVTISGPTTATGTSGVLSTTTLNAGQVFTYNLPNAALNRAFYIKTSKRAYAYHVSSYGQNEFGMGLLPTINPCNGSQRIDFFRTTASSEDAAIVTIPSAGTASLTFRGQPFQTYGSVRDQISINGVPHSVILFPNSAIAAAGTVNTLTSNERFHVGVVSNTGGASTGNYGYYSNYEARVEAINIQTGTPDDFITAGEVTLGSPVNYCLTLTSCGTQNTIKSIAPGRYTQSATVNSLTCISYTMSTTAPICARDTIRAIVQNEFGRESTVCLEFVNRNNDLIVNTLTASPVICQPGGTTSMTVVAISSGRNYTYQWITPDKQVLSTSVVVGAVPGRYLISVGDGNRCIDTTSIVLRADAPAVGLVGANASSTSFCVGTSVPYALSSTAGTYAWSVTGGTILSGGTPTSQTATVRWAGPGTGTLRVVVTSPNGCTAALTRTVQLQAAPVLSFSVQNAACFGQASGSINLTPSGSTTPYSYTWSNGVSTEDLTNVPSGPYSVSVADRGRCVSSGSAVVGQPTPLTVTPTVTNVACNGRSTGAVSLSVSGGTPGYTYLWSNGATSQNLTGVAAGTYTVRVTDANSCTASQTVSVSQPAALSLPFAQQNIACNGANTGSVTLAPTGGTGVYTYRWQDGVLAQDRNALPAGTYSVTVTDANGCTANTTISLTQPPALTLTTAPQHPRCFGASNGQIDLTVQGGTGAYTYLWSNGAQTQDVPGLVAGTYSVTVTDANGCTQVRSETLTQPAALTLAATPQNPGCNGASTGSISLTATGGTGTYAYRWQDGVQTQNRTALPAGTYSVTLTDANACSLVRSLTLTNPPALSLTTARQNPGCNGASTGSIDLTVGGGTPNYTYLWTTGPTTQNLTGVAAGTYRVTVTDANGCSQTLAATLTNPPALTLATTRINVACHGASTGSIDLTPSGGTPAYSYRWVNAAAPGSVVATTQDITGRAAGTYSVTVTDANGCTATTQTTLSQPTALSLTTTPQAAACFGANTGQIALAVSGGTTPYGYLWSNGDLTDNPALLTAGTYSVTVTDGNGCRATATTLIGQPTALSLTLTPVHVACFGGNTGQVVASPAGGTLPYTFEWTGPVGNGVSTQNLTGQPVGTYSLTLTDANGCTLSQSQSLTQPPALTATESHTNVSCFGGINGSIDLTPNGGVLPYTYLWPNGSNMQAISGLSSNTYAVTITDVNGCSFGLNVPITEPLPLTVIPQPSDVLCNGQFASIVTDTRGGTLPYAYLWSNGATTPSVYNLPAGTYALVVTDGNSCTATTSATIVQPTPFGIAASVTAVACNQGNTGAIKLTVEGATPPYAFSILNSASAVVGSTTLTTGLAAGTYKIIVGDQNACTQSLTVSISEPPAITLAATATPVGCFGNATGAVGLTAAGGREPYGFVWNDGIETQNRLNVPAGPYSVTLTDANGCTATTASSVTQPPLLTLGVSFTDVACFGGSTGAALAEPAGGTLPYSFSWSNGGQTQGISALPEGPYSLTITDGNGCQQDIRFVIDQPTALTVSVLAKNLACFQNNAGQLDVVVAGGAMPYSFLWNDGSTDQNRTGLAAGTYSLTVTDANGCPETRSATLTEPALLTLTATTLNLTCFQNNSGQISLTATGGTLPLTYLWQDGVQTQNRSALAAGAYSVTVTDANGCTDVNAFTLTEPAALTSAIASQSIACFGGSTGSVSITVAGGTLPYSYSWADGPGNVPNRTGLVAGTYQVVVRDANGCQTTNAATLVQPPALTLALVPSPALCAGSSSGSIAATVQGGTPGYTYLWTTGAATQNLVSLQADTYSLTVTDANACTTTQSATVTQPTALTVSSSQTNVLCFGRNTGAASVAASGGTSPYTYLWATGETTSAINSVTAGIYSVTVTDANGCFAVQSFTLTHPTAVSVAVSGTDVACFGGSSGAVSATATGGVGPYAVAWNTGATEPSISGLVAGVYAVTVTDANGCSAQNSLTLGQPTALSAAGRATPVQCFGGADGSISLTVAGGTQPYSYSWADGPTTTNRSSLTAGTYQVVISDGNGCQQIVDQTLTQPNALQLQLATAAISCNAGADGSLSAVASGGTLPYSYAWSNGASSSVLVGMSAGTYSLTLTDANGCSETATATIAQPTALTLAGSTTAVACFGQNTGAISTTVAGGTPLYTYRWTTGAETESLTGLVANTYSVTVTDRNGCTETTSFGVAEPARLTLQTSQTNVTCNGGTDGAIVATLTGGTGPYSYTWVNSSAATLPNAPTQTGLVAGTYLLYVSDANGCTAPNAEVAIRQPEFNAYGEAVAPNCAGPTPRPDGQLRLIEFDPAWRYAISEGSSFTTVVTDPGTLSIIPPNGLLTSDLTNPETLAGRAYTVRIYNAEGCTKDLVLTLPQAACSCKPEPVCVPAVARKTR
jgi:hypothetical protein